MTEPEDIEEREDAGFEEEAATEIVPDVMTSPAGQAYFGGDAGVFLDHWLAKLGYPVEGSALLWDENGGIRVLHPETGELLDMAEIAKRVGRKNVTRVQ